MDEWSKFDGDVIKNIGGKEYVLNLQEYLCKKYDIIITDYKTPKQRRNEKLGKIIDKIFKGFDSAFDNMDKIFDGLDKALDSVEKISKSMNGLEPVNKKKTSKKNHNDTSLF